MSDDINIPVVDRKTGKEVADPGPLVPDFRTGEVLSLRDSSTEELAVYVDALQQLHVEMGHAERAVSEELLARLDRDANWTWRGGGFEVTAPSPEAGTTTYLADALEGELRALIERGTISELAASKACQRHLALELEVPWSADHRALAQKVKKAVGIQVGGVDVQVRLAEARTKVAKAGITALRKISGTGAALDRAMSKQDAPTRKARVKRAE
jgi:hypothetical protein